MEVGMFPSAKSADRCSFVLIDALPLRRTCLAMLLEPYLKERGIELTFATARDLSLTHLSAGIALIAVAQEAGALQDLYKIAAAIKQDAPALRPVALSVSCCSAELARSVLDAGMMGFITADMEPMLAYSALDLVAAGGTFYPSELLRSNPTFSHASASATDVTARQQEVIFYLQKGMSNKLIARSMQLSEATVKIHVRNIMKKIGAKNRTQVVLHAAEHSHVEIHHASGFMKTQPPAFTRHGLMNSEG
jgi:DNA-binding NarL/FixJ family response regulator